MKDMLRTVLRAIKSKVSFVLGNLQYRRNARPPMPWSLTSMPSSQI